MNRFFWVLLVSPLLSSAALAQPKLPSLSAITGEGVCTATKSEQESKRATVKLLQSASGFRILEVENERHKGRGPATQVEDKETGHVGYFLDFGGRGSIVVEFWVEDGKALKSKLFITKAPQAGESEPTLYEYDCEKKAAPQAGMYSPGRRSE